MPPRQPASSKRFAVPSLAEGIRQGVERKIRTRLGLSASQPLPNDVRAFIKATADATASKAVELSVTRDSEELARDAARGSMFASFGEKVAAARTGIDFIAQSGDVSEILRRRSELLWAKRQALSAAGFSPAEAMQILLADIAARGQ